MFKNISIGLLATILGLTALPLWGQDIQKLLLHAQDSKAAIELMFLNGNRFEMQVTETKSGNLSATLANTEVLRGQAKRVADRLELSVDGRSIGYVQMWTGSGHILAQRYWGGQQDPRAFVGIAFR